MSRPSLCDIEIFNIIIYTMGLKSDSRSSLQHYDFNSHVIWGPTANKLCRQQRYMKVSRELINASRLDPKLWFSVDENSSWAQLDGYWFAWSRDLNYCCSTVCNFRLAFILGCSNENPFTFLYPCFCPLINRHDRKAKAELFVFIKKQIFAKERKKHKHEMGT